MQFPWGLHTIAASSGFNGYFSSDQTMGCTYAMPSSGTFGQPQDLAESTCRWHCMCKQELPTYYCADLVVPPLGSLFCFGRGARIRFWRRIDDIARRSLDTSDAMR